MSSAPLRFTSVTTILKDALGSGDALIGWAARTVAERAFDRLAMLQQYVEDGDRDGALKWLSDARWANSGKAAERGTAVHKMLEAYSLGEPVEVPEGLEGYHEQVVRFLDDHQPRIEASEAAVYNVTYRYAGTLDMLAEIGGRLCVVDMKTTDKPPTARSRPPYPEVALQLCAYAHAEKIGISPATSRTVSGRRYYVYDPALQYADMPKVDGALGLMVSPYDYRLVPVRVDDEVFKAFAYIREAARWRADVSRRVIGPDITAPALEEEAG